LEQPPPYRHHRIVRHRTAAIVGLYGPYKISKEESLMNRIASKVLYLAGVTVFGSSLALGAGATTQNQAARHATSAGYNDETSIRTAAETSMSQVDLGKLAEQRSQNAEVKKFAQQMVEEHSKLTEQLRQLGSSEHINLPTSVARRDADTHRQLQKESGVGFDKNYMQQVVSELEKSVGEFKRGASATNKLALKEFYERNQPTLESELQQAKQLSAHAR
jgi:putative membrane protein